MTYSYIKKFKIESIKLNMTKNKSDKNEDRLYLYLQN